MRNELSVRLRWRESLSSNTIIGANTFISAEVGERRYVVREARLVIYATNIGIQISVYLLGLR